ncbi:MAG: ubiquitin-like protein Pup [Micropruina sp.]|nr:MAG: ubiquitin-like protein Pup [Micropruina sp.]
MAERIQRKRAPQRDEAATDHGQTQEAKAVVDYDALLDQIDAVLESDAEEYVRSFVQKGGQ